MIETQVLPAAGHSYVQTVLQPATYLNPGIMQYVCSVDGYSYTEAIPVPVSYTHLVRKREAKNMFAGNVKIQKPLKLLRWGMHIVPNGRWMFSLAKQVLGINLIIAYAAVQRRM